MTTTTVYETLIDLYARDVSIEDAKAVFEIDTETVQLETTYGPDQYEVRTGAELIHIKLGDFQCDRKTAALMFGEAEIATLELYTAEEVAS